MDELDAKVDLAENFLRAGNTNRAEELCREVLSQRHNDRGAFLCLFDIHMARDQIQEAFDLCKWRLARTPECPESHICKLIAFGRLSAQDPTYDHVRRMTGENYMSGLRLRLANYPFILARAEIIHSVYFLDSQDTLKLIELERQKGHLDPIWLNDIERSLNVHTGNTGLAKPALMERLSKNPLDAGALHDLSVVYFFSGRLFSAIKYARQAKKAAPEQSAESQEVIIASVMSLLPLFWLGHIIIVLTVFLGRSLEDYLAMPLRYGGLLGTILAYGGVLTHFLESEAGGNNIILIVILMVGGWSAYILFSFGSIGTFFSKRSKSVGLSKKY